MAKINKQTYPKKIKEAGLSASVYRYERSKGGTTYEEFVVTWSEGGKRRSRSFSEPLVADQEARKELRRVSKRIIGGDNLNGTQRQDFGLAQRLIEPFGIPVSTACAEYADARAKLAGKGSVLEAVDYFLRHFNPDLPQKSVREVYTEFLDRIKKDVSTIWWNELRTKLLPFVEHYETRQIRAISKQELDDYVDAIGGSRRSRYNMRAMLVRFWNYAKARGYLPRNETTAAELMEEVKDGKKIGKIEIFTPAQLRALLLRQNFETLPFVAIGAFAGVRSFEITRLKWKHVKWEAGVIEVNAESSKVGLRRLAPITPALAAFLAPYRDQDPEGAVCFDYAHTQEAAERRSRMPMLDKDGNEVVPAVNWKRNMLRHSFVSYRVADVKSVPQVSDEAGNSPQIIKTNYLERVMPAEAVAYWGLRPEPHLLERVATAA